MANNKNMGNKNPTPEKGETGLGLGVSPSHVTSHKAIDRQSAFISTVRLLNYANYLVKNAECMLKATTTENPEGAKILVETLIKLSQAINEEIDFLKRVLELKEGEKW
jgi:hypothetical protein